MLTLGAAGVTLKTLDNTPIKTTAWMRAEPLPLTSGAQRCRLAPGIWIVRQRQWWPVSVLDTAAELPYDDDVPPNRRTFQFPEWHTSAACNGIGNVDAMFFGVDDARRPSLPPRMFRAARAICATCPVQVECLTHALAGGEEFGIWAGTTGRQRAKLRARLNAGETVDGIVSAWLTS